MVVKVKKGWYERKKYRGRGIIRGRNIICEGGGKWGLIIAG